jgi:hypothetical protein
MKILAITSDLDSGPRIAGVAAPHPVDDPRAHHLTLWLSEDPADLDATWTLTALLTRMAPVIAEDGWSAALRRYPPPEQSNEFVSLVLVEDRLNILGGGHVPDRRWGFTTHP